MSPKARWLYQVSGPRLFLVTLLLGVFAWLPATRAAQAPEVIRIGTLPGLRYDISTFSVRPGASVQLVFSNSDEMIHNLLITRPGARERVVQAALALGAGAADQNFVPASADVLWATPLVGPDASFTLTFTAPSAEGDYPFVCTMPGHGLIMFGTMRVTRTPAPPVRTPVEMPAPAGAAHDTHVDATGAATVVRGFMPEAGPASITVQLPGNVSYVWDAGAGRFRYVWVGGGAVLPSSPERGLAQINGEIFYREPAYPLRFGETPENPPALVEFKGYSRDASGIPEFETLVDGVSVRERAEVVNGRFIRRFRVDGATTTWFAAPEGVTGLEASGGSRQGAYYRFTGEEFTVAYSVPGNAALPAAAR